MPTEPQALELADGVLLQSWTVGAGTGGFNPFLSIQARGAEEGVNTTQNILDNVNSDGRNHALQVGDIPKVMIDGKEYYAILLDLNESNNSTADAINLDLFRIYTSSAAPTFTDENGNNRIDSSEVSSALAGLNNVFSLGSSVALTDAGSSGSGGSDYRILIPVEMLGSDASTYVTFHVGMSDSNGGFEEFGTGIQETAAPPPPPPVAGLAIAVSADALDGALDELGETVVYTSTVTNTGNYALAGVDVTGAAGENGVLVSGDTDGDDLLDLNESWVFTYAGAQALTQNDLDAGGAFSSTATATTTSDSTATDTDTANEPIVQLPEIEAELTATVDGGTADIVGEDVEFTLTVKNTGNVTLDGAALDPVPTGAIRTGDVDNDNLLSVGETWTYSFAHDVTQADLDAGGVIGADIDVAAGSGTRSAEDNDNAASVTVEQKPEIEAELTATVDGGTADVLGEDVEFTLTVKNTGNVTLDGATLSPAPAGAVLTGDVGGDNKLSVGETWTYSFIHDVTQDDLDAGGVIGADIDVAAGDGTRYAEDNDNAASVTVEQKPDIEAELTATVDGGTADVVGEDVEFTLTVKNTGNVTLDGATLTPAPTGAVLTGDVDDDNKLSVGETWTYSFIHDVTQADLDSGGVIEADIDVVAGSGTREASDDDNVASVAVEQKPGIVIENYVSTNGVNWYDADTVGPVIGQNQNVQFAFVVRNTGNVTLTDVTLSDPAFDLNGAAAGNNHVISSLAPNGTSTHIIAGTWQSAAFSTVTTGTGTYSAGTTADTDALNYFGAFDGPGVRTPGFWSNNGLQFWNGNANDQAKAGLNFASTELSTSVNGTKGLLLGDWNNNGSVDAGETNHFFISLTVAQTIINASLKTQHDARYVLGRDVVASWLNHLAGNDLGDASDAGSPRTQLQAAIDWLETSWDANSNGSLAATELNMGAANYRTSGANWTGGASTLHTNLDGYNNSGSIGSIQYSADGDNGSYFTLLQSHLNAASALTSITF